MNKSLSLLLAFQACCIACYSQYCISGGPTATADSNVESVTLMGETMNISHVGCPGVAGVEVLTSQVADVDAGSAYTLNVQFGTCGGDYAGAGEAWIDYNQDNIFDASESLGQWMGTPPVASTSFPFFVPAGAMNGTTRMRVTQEEAGALPLDPCATFTWGSVMDFSIEIGNGVDCSAYPGDDIPDAIPVGTLPYTHSHSNAFCYSNKMTVYASPDVFYEVLPDTSTDFIRASLCGSDFDTYLSVLDPQGNVLFFNDESETCAPDAELLFPTAGIDTCYIVVQGWNMESGDYELVLTDQYFLGITESAHAQVRVYPNPVADHLTIQGVVPDRLQIVSLAGRVELNTLPSSSGIVDVSGLSAGIYTLMLEKEGQVFHQMIVVQ